jgi:hypothetical protein
MEIFFLSQEQVVYHGDGSGFSGWKDYLDERNQTAKDAIETQRPQGKRLVLCAPSGWVLCNPFGSAGARLAFG